MGENAAMVLNHKLCNYWSLNDTRVEICVEKPYLNHQPENTSRKDKIYLILLFILYCLPFNSNRFIIRVVLVRRYIFNFERGMQDFFGKHIFLYGLTVLYKSSFSLTMVTFLHLLT